MDTPATHPAGQGIDHSVFLEPDADQPGMRVLRPGTFLPYVHPQRGCQSDDLAKPPTASQASKRSLPSGLQAPGICWPLTFSRAWPPMSDQRDQAVHFGRTVSIPTSAWCWRLVVRLRLGRRAVDILLILLEQAGNVVSKQELIARVWPKSVVEDGNLRVHMAALRKALGDGQAGQRYIVTVAQRGYSFVAPLSIEPYEPTHRRHAPTPLPQPAAAPHPHARPPGADRQPGAAPARTTLYHPDGRRRHRQNHRGVARGGIADRPLPRRYPTCWTWRPSARRR